MAVDNLIGSKPVFGSNPERIPVQNLNGAQEDQESCPLQPRRQVRICPASIVGNQHKWDRLGPEKIIIMKSCVGAP